MADLTLYSVRDPAGNLYGPATIPTLRDWYRQGRIVASMQIAPQGTSNWLSLPAHPEMADLFTAPSAAVAAPTTTAPVMTTPATTPAASTPAPPAAAPAATTPTPAAGTAASSMPDVKAVAEKAKRFAVQDFRQLQHLAPLAFWGSITAAAGVVICCGCGGLLGIAGAVMGALSLDRSKNPDQPLDPRVRTGAYIALALGALALLSNCAGLTVVQILRHFHLFGI